MSDPYFFGYGSLVNDATHTYPDARPALLQGWRRAWVGSQMRGVVLLTAVQSPGDAIDGLVAAVPSGDWAALDKREEGYDRLWTQDVSDHALPHAPEMAVYSVHPDRRRDTSEQVILQSYLDVVIQGFSRVFGEDGVTRFFDTTIGWHTPILNDRADPIYPRHQRLSAQETALVDHHIVRVGGTVRAANAASGAHRF